MFISEKEARARIQSENNLINRLNIPVEQEQEPEPDDEPKYSESEPEDPDVDPVRAAILAGRRATNGHGRGRYPGVKNKTFAARALIGATAQITGAPAAAKIFDVSTATAHQYSHGKNGQAAPVMKSLLDRIEEDTQGIRQQVLGVLAFTIAGITPDKIENKDAKELSIIARNLGSIMSATKPPADFGDKTTNAQVIVFSPEQEQESFYPTKEIG